MTNKAQKLTELAELEGMSEEELLEEATYDSIAKGICTNPGCNYTTNVEPDQDTGHCENCGTKTVASCLVLASLI